MIPMERNDGITTKHVVEQDLDIPVLPKEFLDLVPFLVPFDREADPICRLRSQRRQITTLESKETPTVFPIKTLLARGIQTIRSGIRTITPNK